MSLLKKLTLAAVACASANAAFAQALDLFGTSATTQLSNSSTGLFTQQSVGTGAVSATASASYGFLPEFDELVTTGSWSTPVTFAAGDQFIVELTGSNAATNARCRISVQLGDA